MKYSFLVTPGPTESNKRQQSRRGPSEISFFLSLYYYFTLTLCSALCHVIMIRLNIIKLWAFALLSTYDVNKIQYWITWKHSTQYISHISKNWFSRINEIAVNTHKSSGIIFHVIHSSMLDVVHRVYAPHRESSAGYTMIESKWVFIKT